MGCGAARSLLLFGYVFLYCVVCLLICIYFLPLPLHRGCHRQSTDRGPPLLLSGWTPRWPRCVAWRVGGHISKRGCGLDWSFCFVYLCFLCIEAAAGDHAIEVHRCCCPGGLLGGLSAGSGGDGWGALVLSIVYALVVQRGGGLLHRWWGLSGRRISRWNTSTSLLCVEVAGGENYSSSGR